MDVLRTKYLRLLKSIHFDFKRYLYFDIQWDDRLIIIKGQRGVGKTTLLLQFIRDKIEDTSRSLYVSLDDLYFLTHSLSSVVEEFVQYGGTHLILDEVHRYPFWSIELKNLYDFYPNLKIVATGSSALAIHEGVADLSRRASIYHLRCLSMREYINMTRSMDLSFFSLDDLVQNHEEIASLLIDVINKPLVFFKEFLKYGSYPFSIVNDPLFYEKLKTIVHLIIDNDLPAIENITYETQRKIKKLLYLLSSSVPFKPNISELSQKVGTSRDRLLKYLQLLSRSDLLHLVSQSGSGNSIMQKPDKIYLDNPTLMYALDEGANIGTLRETFFLNQLTTYNKVHYPKKGDFLVNERYTFEIGGMNKSKRQIASVENAFLALDNLEYGFGSKIPLWLFGFLY